MAFVPVVDQPIWMDGRADRAAIVKGVALEVGKMAILPLDGGQPLWVTISDRWSAIPPRPTFPDLWCLVTPDAVSKGFPSRQTVINNAPPEALALLHIHPDNTIDIERPFL